MSYRICGRPVRGGVEGSEVWESFTYSLSFSNHLEYDLQSHKSVLSRVKCLLHDHVSCHSLPGLLQADTSPPLWDVSFGVSKMKNIMNTSENLGV